MRRLARLLCFAQNASRYRQISTTVARYDRPGLPGENMPFSMNMGKYKMTLMLSLFFGIGTSAPWAVIMWLFIK